MKTIIFFLLLATIGYRASAQVYTSPQGKIHFHSSAPLEDIDAISSEANCILNTATKKVTAKVEMESFVFPKPLMQKHFNESYSESDKFPYATLEADISEKIPFKKDGVYNITLIGVFELHGVKQERVINGQLRIKDGQPESGHAEFDVKLVDHKIKIPTVLVMKIAEVVKVDVDFVFNKNAVN